MSLCAVVVAARMTPSHVAAAAVTANPVVVLQKLAMLSAAAMATSAEPRPKLSADADDHHKDSTRMTAAAEITLTQVLPASLRHKEDILENLYKGEIMLS